ncbi:MAG: hypothetical protein EOP09_03040, partial [Proteobacteria bacterium]
SILTPDAAIWKLFADWRGDRLPKIQPSMLQKIVIDPSARKVLSWQDLGASLEFPMWNRDSKSRSQHLYLVENRTTDDPISFDGIKKIDFDRGHVSARLDAPKHQTLGEPVIAQDKYLLHMGYDGLRDETFVDIRDSETLELIARAWTGTFVPLGFHGSYSGM